MIYRKLIPCFYMFLMVLLAQTIVHAQTGVPTGSDPTCPNGLVSFQKQYSGSKSDVGFTLLTTADSGVVVAGYTNSYGSGGLDGLIMKLNRQGQILWSRAIGGAGDDQFFRLNSTSDGGYVAVGFTKSYGGSPNGSAWMVKLNAGGTVQWSRRYDDGNPDGSVAYDVTPTSDGGYALAGTNQNTPGLANAMVIKTDNNGNVTWSKTFNSGSSDQATGIIEDGGALLVTAFQYGQSTSLYDGILMKLDPGSGASIWTKSYDIDGSSNWFSEIQKRNGGYTIFCNNASDFGTQNGAQIAMNVNTDGSVAAVYKLPASPSRNVGGYSVTSDGGFIVTQYDFGNSADAHICKVSNAGVIQWTRKISGNGSQTLYEVRQSPDGGYVFAGSNNPSATVNDSADLFVVRLDTAGNSAGCSMTNANFVISTPTYTLNPNFVWLATTSVTYSAATSVSVASANSSPSVKTLCASCKMPVPVDVNCTYGISLFQRQYYGNKADVGNTLLPTADSGLVVAGYTNSYGSGGTDGLLMKLNRQGQTLWSRATGGAGNEQFFSVKATSDGGYIGVGFTSSYGGSTNGSAWMVKFDGNGTVQWSRRYDDGNTNGSTAYDVVQTSDGGYALAGTNQNTPGSANAMVIKTDNNGNISWSKSFNSGNSDQATGIIEDAGVLVVTAFQYGQSTSLYDGVLMKLDPANGNVTWSKSYNIDGKSNWFAHIQKRNGGYSIFCNNADDFGTLNGAQIVMNVTTDGAVTNVYKLPASSARNVAGYAATSDGGFIVTQYDFGNSADAHVCKVSSTGAIQWRRTFGGPGNQILYEVRQTADGGYAFAGSTNTTPSVSDSADVFIVRTDSTGLIPGCTRDSSSFLITAATATVNNSFVWSSITDIVYSISTSVAGTTAAINPSVRTTCSFCMDVRKPSGTLRTVSGSGVHTVKMYPNPTNGQLNLVIDADYDDLAEITIIDWFSNKPVFRLPARPVSKGRNQLSFNLTGKLTAQRYYAVRISFRNHEQTIKAFSIH